MRASFHEDLDKISEQLVEMTRLAGSAISRATTALLDADLHLAESVIASDEQIVAKAGSVIAGKDIETALALENDDDEMDRLHRDIFNMLMDGKWKYGTEAAVDATLVLSLIHIS